MPRSLFLLLALLSLSFHPVLAAEPRLPSEVMGPVAKSKVTPGKRKAQVSQRTAAKSRKRMRASTAAPITAKTPPAPIAPTPAPAGASAPSTPAPRLEVAYFGGGCFWCVEGLFQIVPGVLRVVNGYAGGTVAQPSYKQVLTGTTGHAEVCQVTYDANVVTYDQLLENFWEIHDPTQVDRQGNDVGSQYRSIILYRTEAEHAQAEQSRNRQQRTYRQPIATQIVALDKFWVAEDFHQDYFARHPGAPYCQLVIRPKLEKFQKSVGRK